MMIFIFISNTFSLKSKSFSFRAGRAVVVFVRFFIKTVTKLATRTPNNFKLRLRKWFK